MWCNHCQQDVPGVATHHQGNISCPRCSAAIVQDGDKACKTGVASDKEGFSCLDPPRVIQARPPVDLEDWDLDADLSELERLVASVGAGPATSQDSPSGAGSAQRAVSDGDARLEGTAGLRHVLGPPPVRCKRRGGMFSWLVLSLGLLFFVFGGSLLGWSLVAGRGELWNLGLPLALVGQAGLVIGLVLQMDKLHQTDRQTSDVLDELDEQLADLRHSTSLLSASHCGAAQSFYSHLAEGAPAQMLLADLKGQLDMLAVKMAQERR